MDIKLRERADAAEARLQVIEDEIASAILDGNDQAVARLRVERNRLFDDVSDLASAEAVVAERARRDQEDRQARKRKETITEAGRLETRRRKAAVNLDDALKDLEAAWLEHEQLCAALERTSTPLRTGRLLDLNVRKRMMFSAFWLAAPKTASSLGLGFSPGHKRKPMAERTFDFNEEQ
tara:strand:+ start:7724 stop:8260 length:537 start_codon:yes stop_codon:yes gene_type:complete